MNRYFASLLTAAVLAVIILSISTFTLFNRSVRIARYDSRNRMISVAATIAAYLDEKQGGYVSMLEDDIGILTIEKLLAAMGIGRAVVVDSLGLTVWSSQRMIAPGDDVYPYLIDTAAYHRAWKQQEPRFTDVVTIAEEVFLSLYFPCLIDEESRCVIIESDHNFFAALERSRKSMLFLSVLFAAMLLAMIATILFVSRQARTAQELSQRNERLAFLGRTSAELAHELKNPLAIIKSSSDVLRKKYDAGKQVKAFDFLSEEIMRLSRLISDILSFSRERKPARDTIPLQTTLIEAKEVLLQKYPHITFDLQAPGGLCIIGDKDAFVQIVSNLWRNAIQAMQESGRLTVECIFDNRKMKMQFKDSGPGIPHTLAGHIFDPFVSGNKTGTGLGLSIVKTLCERNGWSIRLLRQQRQGACFEIELPEDAWQKS
ncbi:MAG: hypothetical protein GF398_14885 [Chitinivibrionales bacterium]|nr:hypothetical protein [Chitinivibrionales bacterium]